MRRNPESRRAEKYAELGFRSQVQGAPTLNPADVIDRRAMRFLGEGAAWRSHRDGAGDPGFRSASLRKFPTSAPASSWAPAGPSARTIVEAADITRTKGPKRVGPFAVPKAMSSTASAHACDLVQDQGRELFDLARPARLRTIASATPMRRSRSASRT